MTGRFVWLLSVAAVFCALAKALEIRLFLFVGLLLFLVLAYALISVLWAKNTLRIRCAAKETRLMRGTEAKLEIEVGVKCPLPVAPVEIAYHFGRDTGFVDSPVRGFSAASHTVSYPAMHVGTMRAGVLRARVSDIYGICQAQLKALPDETILVMPRLFSIEKPTFAVSDEGKSALTRSTEDNTSPEDIRAYQPGDAMKRVHWKLSTRRRELLVRKYETPAPP
ncbi:MAG: DUF58 domain-containing protein, partial [Oscillospiraceae bacterium]|nr:DUF58 domain-containing protein [Oscillospiraceae bacterium]